MPLPLCLHLEPLLSHLLKFLACFFAGLGILRLAVSTHRIQQNKLQRVLTQPMRTRILQLTAGFAALFNVQQTPKEAQSSLHI